MHNHFGETLKAIAAAMGGFLTIIFLAVGVAIIAKGGDLFYTGLEIALFGVIGSWLSFAVLCGLGELIDQAQRGADAGERLVELLTGKDEEKTPIDYEAMGEKIIEELHSPNCETLDKGDLICTN